MQPIQPGPVVGPTILPPPVRPASEEAAAAGPGLSEEDIRALEEMIVNSEIDQI